MLVRRKANGRDDSRRLILALRIAFMSERRGSQTIARLPSARRPHSLLLLKPANDLAGRDRGGSASAESPHQKFPRLYKPQRRSEGAARPGVRQAHLSLN
jgi:hypothetical protein